ncbi:MFS transporter [Parahaliea mediterranea]|uniref:MFS transporter n=1 Tax=Parahaliea mediterranea TaxID=651086 RepID=UPI000E2F7176|nr:MFS transporter [Parahaliea mediterranea]
MAHSIPALDSSDTSHNPVTRRYAWVVFALTFGLLISDYMSRQVLNAVFPLIKDEWLLTDQQLGLLSGIVALMVGLLTFPLSLLADRWGRIRSLALMAILWSLATLGCALAQSYEQMFLARFLVGVGEAAYGSVGIAVVLSVFPVGLRATLASAFMAGGMFGSVLGVGFGGVIAEHFGWRSAFSSMALFGLVLAVLYPFIVTEKRIGSCRLAASEKGVLDSNPLRTLFSTRSVLCAYIGSGFQLFVAGTLIVWVPSYLNRYYNMETDQAGLLAAFFLVCSGVGTILCGMLSDYLARHCPARKVSLAIAYSVSTFLLLSLAFALPHGGLQLALLTLGMMVVSGTNGPSTAMVANLTNYRIHSTAFATLTLANNLLGMAPGPLLTGRISDMVGLQATLQLVPFMSLLAAGVFFLARWTYLNDVQKVGNSV